MNPTKFQYRMAHLSRLYQAYKCDWEHCAVSKMQGVLGRMKFWQYCMLGGNPFEPQETMEGPMLTGFRRESGHLGFDNRRQRRYIKELYAD